MSGLRFAFRIECGTRTSEAGTAQDARGDFQRQDAAAGNPFESCASGCWKLSGCHHARIKWREHASFDQGVGRSYS